MSGGRRRVGRTGVRQRDVRRAEQQASSPQSARRDVISRFAIMRRTERGAAVWWCTQSNGRPKPGYRTERVALQVAAALREVGEVRELTAYRCPQRGVDAIKGEHWHLSTPRQKKVLTPPSAAGKVVVVSETPATEERTA
jgi:hypothetical protein